MKNVSEALKAKMGVQPVNTAVPSEVPAQAAPDATLNQIATEKKGYPGEEDVDYLASTLMMHQEALQMMAKELVAIKQVLFGAIKAKAQNMEK